MQPIKENVLIKPCEAAEKSEGGILIPVALREPSNKGIVVAAGVGSKKNKMKFKKGDTVFRVKGWGQEVMIDGQLHFIMNQDALLATQ
jgi:chaperonin GroES